MNKSIGSIWCLWDLHNHTDASDGKMSCEQLIDAALSKGIKCLAITDHHTAKNVDLAKTIGEAKGVHVIAGIEFRTEYGQKSVHMIGLFPDSYGETELNSKNLYDLILCQLGLSEATIIQKGKEVIGSADDDKNFKEGIFHVQVDFKEASKLIKKYGGIVTVHAGSKANSIDEEMYHEGKHETSIYESLGPVKDELFKGSYIDICEVRNQKDMSSVDMYWEQFHVPSITASDAHELTKVGIKPCWIKAELSFEGLKHILSERDRISFDEPPLLKRLAQQPSKFIKKVEVTRNDGALMDEIWFDNIEISLNPGLVALIGNKGNGKSAIADIISLCASTHNKAWSFLTDKKFRSTKPYDRSKQTKARITWADNTQSPWITLDTIVDTVQPERVKYIPQNFLENLCTTEDDQEFESEIKKIIFQHIPDAERYGKDSLDDIISFLSTTILADETLVKENISKVNTDIIALEIMKDNDTLKALELAAAQKQKELDNLIQVKPVEVLKPNGEETEASKTAREQIEKLAEANKQMEEQRKASHERLQELTTQAEQLKQVRIGFEQLSQRVKTVKEESQPLLDKYDIKADDVVSFELHLDAIDSKLKSFAEEYKILQQLLTGENNISEKITANENLRKALEQKLSEPERQYQKYLVDLAEWQKKCDAVKGNSQSEGTLDFMNARIKYIKEQLPLDLSQLEEKRRDLTITLLRNKKQEAEVYARLYQPVSDFIKQYESRLADYPISLNASLVIRGIQEQFFDYVSQAAAGSFYGREPGMIRLKNAVENVDTTDEEKILDFAEQLCNWLKYDYRNGDLAPRKVKDQLKGGHTVQELYDYIYQMRYVEPFFQLTMAGKPLSALSPGERGALLLLFYLFLDKDDKPLIVDQPEENLDNESVYRYIVSFIKEAKQKRQIIMVTHNPNLAVVCDADQIIRMNIDKKNKNLVSFESGGIENPIMNNHVLDILEGTYKAFSNRSDKYAIVNRC
jgi:ABC-type lipoprotein export system ATPase subunit